MDVNELNTELMYCFFGIFFTFRQRIITGGSLANSSIITGQNNTKKYKHKGYSHELIGFNIT